MKFGKRLQAEARRGWAHAYLDYKRLKGAIKADVAAADPTGPAFQAALDAELAKVAAFYQQQEERLAAAAVTLSAASSSPQEVAALRAKLLALRKYAALNYLAVVKAAKKRNRHLAAAVGRRAAAGAGQGSSGGSSSSSSSSGGGYSSEGGGFVLLRPLHVLRSQPFFTSRRLAALATRAEVVAQELAPGGGGAWQQPPAEAVLQEYRCAICLDLLRAPVVLTCTHRFCWGCLLAQGAAAAAAAAAHAGSGPHADKDGKQQEREEEEGQGQQGAGAAAGASPPALAALDCAVCRTPQLLDLERLTVDPHLEAFLEGLRRQAGSASATDGSSASSGPEGSASTGSSEESAASSSDSEGGGMGAPSAPRSISAAPQPAPQPAPPSPPAALAAAAAACGAAGAAQQAAGAQVVFQLPGEPALLPPPRPEHAGRLVVCLDLDGTLVTTFTPKRAPLLPSGAISYIVGRGGKLNPGGVFVVERPGLGAFLRRLACFAEVVLFTAGLEEYAAPICDALEARYPGCLHHRLYRPATVHSDAYPCVKDLARLGRPLSRCVLVDDTPLAFYHQPDHGVPVLQFRGDQDDRMLGEAVAPLLDSLAGAADVAAPLARRFTMRRWFAAQGLAPPLHPTAMHRTPSLPALKLAPRPSPAAAQLPLDSPRARPGPAAASSAAPAQHQHSVGPAGTLLVLDFDKTITDWDAGERLCDELAPELTSLLSSLQMPANFVPATNAVLAEMQRRGVSRDMIVECLREMGRRELPAASERLLQWASRRGVETVILSDCNTVFISHILAGARIQLGACVRHVITNPASFHRVPTMPAPAPATPCEEAVPQPATPKRCNSHGGIASSSGSNSGWGWGLFRTSSSSSLPPKAGGAASGAAGGGKPLRPGSSQRLVIEPRHDAAAAGPHGCPLCPANLCKGRELRALLEVAPPGGRQRVIYCGDGVNDLCPSLALGPDDVVLARSGHGLEAKLAERAAAGASARAAVHSWATHAELLQLVQQHAA